MNFIFKFNSIYDCNKKLNKEMIFMDKIKLLIFYLIILIISNEEKNISKQLTKNNSPKISIFLPIYNKGNYLQRSIGSLQSQTLKEIEIISINDGSTDNSLNILKEMAKKDPRISIVNNDKNRGLLFSRGMGILNSKGEYIMCLDPDDQLSGPNILRFLYNKAKKLNVDIIFFKLLKIPRSDKINNIIIFNKIINQPELFHNAFDKDGFLYDCIITNKLVKNKLFKDAFKIFKSYIYADKWNYHEDNIWSIIMHKYANSSLFLNRIVYIYYSNKDSLMENSANILEMKNLLYRHEMFKTILTNKREKKFLMAELSQLLFVFNQNINIIKHNKEIKKLFIIKMEEFKKKYQIPKILLRQITLIIHKIS